MVFFRIVRHSVATVLRPHVAKAQLACEFPRQLQMDCQTVRRPPLAACSGPGPVLDAPPSWGGPAKRHAVAALSRAQRASIRLEDEMPKLKTKSGVKKRFKLTASGKVKAGVAGKRHRLISHNAKYIRQNRGTDALAKPDADRVKLWIPYGLD